MSLQQLRSPESFEGKGVVIPESQVMAALCGQQEMVRNQELFDEFKELCHRQIPTGAFPLSPFFTNSSFSYFEKLIILLAFALENNRKYERIFAFLQDDIGTPYPTLGLAVDLYTMMDELKDEEVVALLSEDHPLNRYLLEFGEAQSPSSEKGLGLARRLVFSQGAFFALYGTAYLPPSMSGICRLLEPPEVLHSVTGDAFYQRALRFMASRLEKYNPPAPGAPPPVSFPGLGLLDLCGEDGTGKQFTLRYIARQLNTSVVLVDFEQLSRLSQDHMKKILRAVVAYCFAARSIPAIGNIDFRRIPRDELQQSIDFILTRFIGQLPGAVLLSREPLALSQRQQIDLLHLDLPLPEMDTQKDFWEFFAREQGISFAPDVSAVQLANTYHFSPGQIRDTLACARAGSLGFGHSAVAMTHISDGVRTLCLPKLSQITTPVEARFTWEDLMLEEEALQSLKQICARVRQRFTVKQLWGFEKKQPYGKGISALFHGPPGTGKTMAVQVIAKELSLDIYRVDLSKIIDKYIGETEKKMGELFDAAKHAGAILFFDEADALFSKRTEVSDSKDKYANVETAYLLQRMEDYSGICILATNISQNFDAAFKRRISFTINISMPDTVTRKKLWESVFPKEAPLSDKIDFDLLAEKFQLTGSNIKNAAVSAAYLAAADQSPISREHLAKALKSELFKIGHITTENDIMKEI